MIWVRVRVRVRIRAMVRVKVKVANILSTCFCGLAPLKLEFWGNGEYH